ncbi:hypothetical protein CHL76_11725 [Marinococcus halophilus]|uniref:HTH cro/C1-type domain-containing protein n=1 Tax=Marinococcus halophilus TaxID=1371 RepID=A0A510Y9K7_MARHA|nr:hypothetical protein [Marinococcus halophilus]OZT79580.1 hypothetical protein CHL76_11725 [Marinococcus halophilus]GEK60064.1 hypothetical protein MHA01_29690 [Marinococcus halophilus]
MSKAFDRYQEVMGKAYIDRFKLKSVLAATIKTERQRQAFSQQELADAIGKPKFTIKAIFIS